MDAISALLPDEASLTGRAHRRGDRPDAATRASSSVSPGSEASGGPTVRSALAPRARLAGRAAVAVERGCRGASAWAAGRSSVGGWGSSSSPISCALLADEPAGGARERDQRQDDDHLPPGRRPGRRAVRGHLGGRCQPCPPAWRWPWPRRPPGSRPSSRSTRPIWAAAATALRPEVVALLNLSRDQLDRVSEVRMLANRWRQTLSGLRDDGGGQRRRPARGLGGGDRPHRSIWVAAGLRVARRRRRVARRATAGSSSPPPTAPRGSAMVVRVRLRPP